MTRCVMTPSGLVYGDGERLILDVGTQGSVQLVRPYLTEITVESQGYDVGYGTLLETTATLKAGGVQFFEGQQTPNLMDLASRLTVSELFAVINRKLDKREAKL